MKPLSVLFFHSLSPGSWIFNSSLKLTVQFLSVLAEEEYLQFELSTALFRSDKTDTKF